MPAIQGTSKAVSKAHVRKRASTEGTSPRKLRSRPRAKSDVGDEVGAAELARRVADALRRFRQDRSLSLDELSERSGVSRAALSQIEGARTNPTLAVLWSTTETVIVLTGAVRVGVGDAVHELSAGDSVFFHADVRHFYENRSTRETRLLDVIHYPR